ncbi:MAG: DUF3786 domain-containing protein [Nitrospirota bacterium]
MTVASVLPVFGSSRGMCYYPYMPSSGEEKAWEILMGLDPSTISANGKVSYDRAAGVYRVKSFGSVFLVDPKERIIRSNDEPGQNVLRKFGYFAVHSCLWYLIHVKDIPLTGRLVKPADLRGGDLFFRGTHALPLDNLSGRYSRDGGTFLRKGREFGGEPGDYGDASVRLSPLPRIPVTIVLWLEDEEFPARADLMFDSSAGLQLPIDVLWSLAMLSIMVML